MDVSGCLGRDGASGGLERVTAVAAVAATKSDLSINSAKSEIRRAYDSVSSVYVGFSIVCMYIGFSIVRKYMRFSIVRKYMRFGIVC